MSEFEEDFAYTCNSGVFTSSTVEHDPAANLTFDGVFHYAHDGWEPAGERGPPSAGRGALTGRYEAEAVDDPAADDHA